MRHWGLNPALRMRLEGNGRMGLVLVRSLQCRAEWVLWEAHVHIFSPRDEPVTLMLSFSQLTNSPLPFSQTVVQASPTDLPPRSLPRHTLLPPTGSSVLLLLHFHHLILYRVLPLRQRLPSTPAPPLTSPKPWVDIFKPSATITSSRNGSLVRPSNLARSGSPFSSIPLEVLIRLRLSAVHRFIHRHHPP